MRLVTHNMLMCNKKGVVKGFPLSLTTTKVEEIETDFNLGFLTTLLSKMDYPVLISAISQVFPDETSKHLPLEYDIKDENTMQKIHHALFEVHVIEGLLTCPESGRQFIIKDGIPNMLLREDEV